MGAGYIVIAFIIYTIYRIYDDSKSWEPYERGNMRPIIYANDVDKGSSIDMSQAAMFMNIDE